MMTFGGHALSQFFGARSRANMTAMQALAELEARQVVSGGGGRLDVRAHLDRACQRSGRKINEINSHEAAALLRASL